MGKSCLGHCLADCRTEIPERKGTSNERPVLTPANCLDRVFKLQLSLWELRQNLSTSSSWGERDWSSRRLRRLEFVGKSIREKRIAQRGSARSLPEYCSVGAGESAPQFLESTRPADSSARQLEWRNVLIHGKHQEEFSEASHLGSGTKLVIDEKLLWTRT